jgi:hypothetical protein
MDQKVNIIMTTADKACKQISRKVAGELRKMTDGMQSGAGSPLENIWDEICVQVQEQKSALWEYYLYAIRNLIEIELKSMDSETAQAIWLQTDQGADWDMDTESKILNDEEVPEKMEVSLDDIAVYILNEYLLKTAAGWKNQRIEKFLDGGMDFLRTSGYLEK